MAELHAPWLLLASATPLVAVLLVWRVGDSELAWKRSLIATGIALCLTVAAWQDFDMLGLPEAHDRWTTVFPTIGCDVAVIDEFSAPLIPLAALLHFSITLATSRTRIRHFPFTWTLVSLSLLLAMLSCREPWLVIALLTVQAGPPWLELRARGRPTRVFLLHTLLSVGLLTAGWALVDAEGATTNRSPAAVAMLIAGVVIRSGVAPLHCWMTDLFENATFGTALLYVTPMAGAYAAVRLVLPIAPDWALQSIALLSLVTSAYAAGMALVQRESRRFFCYLFLSNSLLVLVALEVATPISLTGGLCAWLSVGLSLAGLGLTLRALEARTGRLSLADYHGLYDHMPNLAVFFLLTGLASIGFPGTVGFVSIELLVEGAVDASPKVGIAVVLITALNGIAVLRAYFRLFTGTRHVASISLHGRWPEKVAVLVLTTLILAGGLVPQPGVASRYRAAVEIISRRQLTDHSTEFGEPMSTIGRHQRGLTSRPAASTEEPPTAIAAAARIRR